MRIVVILMRAIHGTLHTLCTGVFVIEITTNDKGCVGDKPYETGNNGVGDVDTQMK